MSVLNTKIKPFTATAFKSSEKDFFEVSEGDVLSKWAIFFFYPADFTFVCPTELADLADQSEELENEGVQCLRYQQTPISHTKPSTLLLMPLARSHSPCWAILWGLSPGILSV